MAGIIFYFEDNDKDVCSGRYADLDLWNYACKIAGIEKAIIINKSSLNITSFDSDMDIIIIQDEKELPKLEGNIVQLVCPWEETPLKPIELWDTNHNFDWYFFGPSSGWKGNFPQGHSFLTIPQKGMGATHSIHVATATMYHRYNIKGK